MKLLRFACLLAAAILKAALCIILFISAVALVVGVVVAILSGVGLAVAAAFGEGIAFYSQESTVIGAVVAWLCAALWFALQGMLLFARFIIQTWREA